MAAARSTLNDVMSPLSKLAISEYAERLAEQYGIVRLGDAPDVEPLVRALGGRVDVSFTLHSETLTVRRAGDFVIHLAPSSSFRQRRFAIAHELGHYVLHYLDHRLDGPATFDRCAGRARAGAQANYFASALLMPAARFRRVHREFGSDVRSIANVFGVSLQAVQIRADTLGLL